MNKIEFIFYKILSRNQSLKIFCRNFYQGLYDLLPRKKDSFYTKPIVYKNSFFGFHDISPISFDDKYILSYKLDFDKRMPKKNEKLSIGYYELGKNEFHNITETYAWNYHKGARLQWINSKQFIFNDRNDNDEYVSKISELNGVIKTIDYPIDTVLFNNKIATSFNYNRLEICMPGYGYALDYRKLDSFAPMDDGLFLVDLEKNTESLLVSLYDLANETNTQEGFYNFVTHTEFSNDGKYISFMHRWVSMDEKNLMNRSSRLLIYDLEKKEYFALQMDYLVSHYVWNSKNQILLYGSKDKKRGHYIVSIDFEKKSSKFEYQSYPEINIDGHQSFITDNLFITDTYPDKFRMAHIYCCNQEKKKLKELVSVYSPKSFQTQKLPKHIACDLHPRVSFSKKFFSFDCIIENERSQIILPILEEIKE